MKKTLIVIDDGPAVQLILEHYFANECDAVLMANDWEAMT